jgi:hypothetical protein
MGIDLVSACVFCAGFLLGGDLPPRDGLSPEIGLSYATLAREIPAVGDESYDVSDVTPKFVLIGLGNAHAPPAGLGAGTPAFEWRLRVAFGPSHDEQIRPASAAQPVIETDGTGRYENFALLGRFPIGSRGSLEAALDRRRQNATDILNVGGEEQTVSEQRNLTAERADGALGWRQRWKDFEAGISARYAKVTGYNATAGAFHNSSGGIFGGSLEGRWRRGCWTFFLSGEYLSGSIDVHEESFPDFAPRDTEGTATLQAYRFSVAYSWPRTDIAATVTYDKERLPFVSLAVLGAETVAFDAGYHPDSRVEELFGDLTVRYAFTPAIRARLGLRLAGGSETVDLTDAVGSRPPRTLEVDRGGRFGGGLSRTLGFPELTFFLGADFAIGGAK